MLIVEPPPLHRQYAATQSRHPDQILAARGLRASGSGNAGAEELDSRGDHLVVRDSAGPAAACRLLPPGRFRLCHFESGFDLTGLSPIRSQLVEVSGIALRRDGRRSAVTVLLDAVAQYARREGYRYVLAGGPTAVSGTPAAVHTRYQVRPHLPWSGGQVSMSDSGAGWFLAQLRERGALACGPFAYDPIAGGAEVLVLWDLSAGHRNQVSIRDLSGFWGLANRWRVP